MTIFPEEVLLLPDSLATIYDVRSCLKYSEQSATYLLLEKSSGRQFLLKTASDPVCMELLFNEQKILTYIHQSGDTAVSSTFPSPVHLEIHGDTCFYIRTYIEGKTLEELCETNYKKPGLPVFRALDYIISLTEILGFFHSQNPPLIHRDIKPQNVVIDMEGGCHFIDLGISRFYHSSKKGDTLIMGTKLTAPPEQFGFQQTDMRSDLYSLGILLYYCITGQYEIQDRLLCELSPDLQQIIRKLTMFDPDKRYQSAMELLPVLLNTRYPEALNRNKNKLFPRFLLTGTAFMLFINLIFSGFLWNKWQSLNQSSHSIENTVFSTENSIVITESSANTSQHEYHFAEPLIEEAVRTQLNRPDGIITHEDLSKISTIHIFGLQVYNDENDFAFKGDVPWCHQKEWEASGLYKQKGSISSLEDILYMPNLTTLCLYNQQISDISALKDTSIAELGLGLNPLTDLSPLAGNESIHYLNISALEIDNLDIITTIPNLTSLNISATQISSLENLEKCPLETLNLFQLFPDSYTPLMEITTLRKLTLHSLSDTIISELEGCSVTDLTFYYSNQLLLDHLEAFPHLEWLYFRGGSMQPLQIQSPYLPNLRYLDLTDVTIEDFRSFSGMQALETLLFYDAECQSYEGLDQLTSLKVIDCTKEQGTEIQQYYPDNPWYLHL